MSDFFKRVFGIIFAQEDDKQITLRGMKVVPLARDIMSVWSTSKIESNMFTRFKSSEITFPKFFAPDFHYMLRAIRDNYKNRRTAASVINRALKELEEFTWLKQLTEEIKPKLDRTKLNLFKLSPLPHQDEFFNIYDERTQRYGLTGYLLSAAAGSGKTLTCLMTAEMVHADLVVMVVPKNSVYKVWSRHLKEEYKKPQEHWIAADGQPYKKERFIITHYEALEKTLAVVKSTSKSNVVVVLDESHNMNEMESLRTQHFIELCRVTKSQNVLWSSGTPIKAMGYESIPLLRTIDPLFTPDVEERFKKIFGRNAKRALDILRNRMGMISYRVDKADVVDNKPSSVTVQVKIPNGNAYTLDAVRSEMQKFITERLKHYKDNFKTYKSHYDDGVMEYEKLADLEDEDVLDAFKKYLQYFDTISSGYDPRTMQIETKYCNYFEQKVIIPTISPYLRKPFKNACSVVKYMDLKVLGEALGGILGRKRAQCHVEMVPYMTLPEIIDESAKKTVVFTSYVEVVNAINKELMKKKYQPVLVYGETNKDLTGLVTKFEKQAEANPLVATYQSLSTAVPLIVANTAVFVNTPFRDHELTQAKARVDRLGQDTPVVFVSIELDTGKLPNVSTRARDIMEWSREQISQILGKSYSGDVLATAAGSMESIEETEDFTDMGQISLEYYDEGDARDFDEIHVIPDSMSLEEFAELT